MKGLEEIAERFREICRENVPASELTTYKTGGKAALTACPRDSGEAFDLFRAIRETGVKFFILGAGSNVLISDRGFDGVIVLTSNLNGIRVCDNEISCESGALWDKVCETACENSLAGLEKTSYIPGTAGGAVRMNAGAFGIETFDFLKDFTALNLETLKTETVKKNEVRYGYRFVEGIEKYFILSASFTLIKSSKDQIRRERETIIAARKEKQPLEYPSAGSVFKRPKGDFASRLIDVCGLKGLRIGGAMISQKHAGFVINYDKASAFDIYALIQRVKKEVFEKTGVKLEEEQIFLGEFQ